EREQEKKDHSLLKSEYLKIINTIAQNEESIRDYQKILEHYNLLKSAYKKMVESCEKFTQEKQHEQEAHNILRTQYNQLKEVFPINKLKEMECTVQQVSDLTSQVITLQATKQKLEDELRHARWKCHMLMAEKEQKMVAETFQQLQYKEMKKNCKQCYELLKKHNKDGSEDPEDP
ncbi:myosin-9-like isoform X1, partial [Tachysurus ichikawai]